MHGSLWEQLLMRLLIPAQWSLEQKIIEFHGSHLIMLLKNLNLRAQVKNSSRRIGLHLFMWRNDRFRVLWYRRKRKDQVQSRFEIWEEIQGIPWLNHQKVHSWSRRITSFHLKLRLVAIYQGYGQKIHIIWTDQLGKKFSWLKIQGIQKDALKDKRSVFQRGRGGGVPKFWRGSQGVYELLLCHNCALRRAIFWESFLPRRERGKQPIQERLFRWWLL